MKRQIVVKLFGEEIVNVSIDESDDEIEEIEVETSTTLTSADSALSNKGSIGFDTPWSVDYWDDED